MQLVQCEFRTMFYYCPAAKLSNFIKQTVSSSWIYTANPLFSCNIYNIHDRSNSERLHNFITLCSRNWQFHPLMNSDSIWSFCFHRQMLVQRPRGKGVLKTRVHNTKLQLSRQDCVTINPSLLYQVLPALRQMAMYQSLYTAPIWRLVHHRFTIQLAVDISACTEELTRISNESKKETHVSYWHAFEVVVSTWQLFKSITIPQSSTNDKIYQFLSQNLNHFQKCESVSLTQY